MDWWSVHLVEFCSQVELQLTQEYPKAKLEDSHNRLIDATDNHDVDNHRITMRPCRKSEEENPQNFLVSN